MLGPPELETAATWWGPLAALRPEGLRLPPPGTPLRVAFVGQRTYFELCSQRSPSPVVDPVCIDHRAGADTGRLVAAVRSASPHVVVVFRPELIEPGAFSALDALTLGVLTEPLPRVDGVAHPDLARREHDLARVAPDEFDRIIAFDPEIVPTASRYAPIWRSVALPVADEVFGWNPTMANPPRLLFVGRTTDHRQDFLLPLKHHFDLLHIEHGVFGEEFIELAHQGCDVAVNLHNEPYPSFENRVSLHLAAGHLVLSEPLSPTHGLEPEVDFLQFSNPDELLRLVAQVRERPASYDFLRWRGRQKAERFRASRVWARLVHDLLLDVSAFGGRSARSS